MNVSNKPSSASGNSSPTETGVLADSLPADMSAKKMIKLCKTIKTDDSGRRIGEVQSQIELNFL